MFFEFKLVNQVHVKKKSEINKKFMQNFFQSSNQRRPIEAGNLSGKKKSNQRKVNANPLEAFEVGSHRV